LKADQITQHLRLCSDNLNPEGSVFIDALVPFFISKHEDGARDVMRKSSRNNGASYELWDRRMFDPVSQIEERHMRSLRICNGEVDSELLFKTWRRYYSVQEIKAYAKKACLKVEVAEPYYDSDHLDGYFLWLKRDCAP
jgi:hypothetical protein